MGTFTVAVVLESIELDDEVLDTMFRDLPDAVPSDVNGVVTISAPVKADDPEAAAHRLIARLRPLLPGARPVRLDQDLVSITDIAERTGRTRESVRLLADGRRGPGGFPAPIGTVGDGIRVWPWTVVVDWFRESLGHDLDERGVPPAVAARVDAMLSNDRTAPSDHISWRRVG